MKIITISAKARHGKDYTASTIKEELEKQGYRVLIYHYADLLKWICKTFFGWNGKKDVEGRTMLQYVGTDVIRSHNPNYWVEFVRDFLDMFRDEWDYVILPDTRFPNEIEVLREMYDVLSLKVVRPDFDNGLTEEQKQHVSETALDNYNFDNTLINTGDTLYDEIVVDFVEHLLSL